MASSSLHADVAAEFVLFQLFGAVSCDALFLRQIVEQLADVGVLAARRRLLIKLARLRLHRRRRVAHRVQTQRANQPHGLAIDEAADVLAADQRDVVAEFLLGELDQAPAMARFLQPHAVENGRRRRKILPQAFGEVGVDFLILFFERDCQGENLALGQTFETAHT